MNKDSYPTMGTEGATKSNDADILRQVWDARVFMYFPHNKSLARDTKSNAL